jgi:hypothetical protein
MFALMSGFVLLHDLTPSVFIRLIHSGIEMGHPATVPVFP